MRQEKIHVTVIGAGLMGHAIAQVFLAGGHNVYLHDRNREILADAPGKIRDIYNLLKQDPSTLINLTCEEALGDAVQNAELVIEAGPEKLEIKQAIFAQLSELAPDTAILATNTSAIPIHEVGAKVVNRSRVVGTHFWNPPHLVRLVEVVQSDKTALSTVQRTISLLEGVAMKPVHVKHDIPGFIGNRLQHAMKREAIALVSAGVCDAETIDTVVKHSFGSRLAILGPMEQSDLVGLNLTLDILTVLFPTLDNSTEPPPLLVDKVKRGETGMATGKGFRDWTKESAEQVKNRMRDYLTKQSSREV